MKRQAKCPDCMWPVVDGLCRPQPFRFPRMLTDEEARRVVLPRFPSSWNGRSYLPQDRELDAGVERRYLEACGIAVDDDGRAACGCADVDGMIAPCERHKGAFYGRDWKTGEVWR